MWRRVWGREEERKGIIRKERKGMHKIIIRKRKIKSDGILLFTYSKINAHLNRNIEQKMKEQSTVKEKSAFHLGRVFE